MDMSDRSYDRLSSQERELIKNHYVKKEESYEINEKLRNGEQLSGEQLLTKDALDRACLSYKTETDMASTRFVNFDYLRNAYKLDIERYKDIDRSKVADEMKQFIGSEMSSKGFTSVSLNESGNGMFNNLPVTMKINIPKGKSLYIADNPGEYEAILGRNTKIILKDVRFKASKIKGMEKEYGKVLLTYEVVK